MRTRSSLLTALALAAALLAAPGIHAQAQDGAKDIVLDRVATAANAPAAAATPAADVLVVSVLLESPDGTLTSKPLSTVFTTGDRFRVRLLTARMAKVSLYNTDPSGRFNPAPVWQGQARPGQETVTPRLRLDGRSGTDLLHIVLEPEAPPQGLAGWLARWIGKDGATAPKDIHLDSQETVASSYLVNTGAQGLVATVRIRHQ